MDFHNALTKRVVFWCPHLYMPVPGVVMCFRPIKLNYLDDGNKADFPQQGIKNKKLILLNFIFYMVMNV